MEGELNMHTGTLRQILVITDGESNQGKSPIAAAAEASEFGYTVNVIGISKKDGHLSKEAISEIEAIASAGNGMSQTVFTKQLSQTVQMVTKQAMTQTLYGLVNRKLKKILGSDQAVEELSPEKRIEVVETVENFSETASLELVILVDCSGSMYDKLPAVKEALVDLSISLEARMGENSYTVYVFPGKRREIECLVDWTPDLTSIESVFPKLTSGGMTPTGPAIEVAIQALKEKKYAYRGLLTDEGSYYGEME